MIEEIEKIMVPARAGDPMTGLKWTRKTTEKVSQELKSAGITVSARTVARLLIDLDYRLRVNYKKLSGGSALRRSRELTGVCSPEVTG